MDGSALWGLLTILGPIILVVAIVWAILHNRVSRRTNRETEAATAARYDQTDREDKEDAAR